MKSLGLTTLAYGLVLTVVALAYLASGRPRPRPFSGALVVLEVAVVGVVVMDAVHLLTGPNPADPATHLGYLLVAPLIIPAAAAAVRMDRSRWGSAALAVGCLVQFVVTLRLFQTSAVAHA